MVFQSPMLSGHNAAGCTDDGFHDGIVRYRSQFNGRFGPFTPLDTKGSLRQPTQPGLVLSPALAFVKAYKGLSKLITVPHKLDGTHEAKFWNN